MTVRFLAIGLLAVAAVSHAATPDFNKEIRPILSNYCFHCHGPDEKERKGGENGLRLDTLEGALVDLGGYKAIVPGDPDKSELIKRLITDDDDEFMPPKKTGKVLNKREIDLLRAWIKGGAPYAKHWAYEAPKRPVVPPVPAAAWEVRNPIDAFIFERLAKEKLKPQPEADRPTLARRAALDLTGLPPSPEEVDAFVKDTAANAFEHFVDAQLAKPAYGEHWARMWLDLARYADSAGFADDPSRNIWAYRDYVIRAYNSNKPFDQFSIEQIAGDLLPNPTEEQIIATAFHRNTLTNSEGGTPDEEYRSAAIVDRANTTMAVWMGTSFACAQCHTHKYDPISHHEYFQMYAFFNNTEDDDRRNEEPLLHFYSESQKQQRTKISAEIAEMETGLKNLGPDVLAKADQWVKTAPVKVEWNEFYPTTAKAESGTPLSIVAGGKVLAGKNNAKTDSYTFTFTLKAPQKITAIKVATLTHESLPGMGPGFAAGNFTITRIHASQVPAVPKQPDSSPIKFKSATADFTQENYDAASVIADAPKADKKKKLGWAIGGGTGESHSITLLAATPVELPAGTTLSVTLEMKSGAAGHNPGLVRIATTSSDKIGENLAILAAAQASMAKLPNNVDSEWKFYRATDAERAAFLRDYYLRQHSPEMKPKWDKLAALRRQLDSIRPDTVPIQRELAESKRRKTQIHIRGNYLNLGDAVTEGVPAIFHPLPKDAPMNRLSLARWLVDGKNPLTARVVANRYWESIFGIGIVRTSEEFGAQGEQPSNAELLDWLATELVALKWDTKAFLKTLVTSAAYRQSSRVTPEALERDPENQLVSRGPRVRHTAEMVRDQALAVSGLLSPKMYGPSVRPAQPSSGLAAAFGGKLDWKASEGEDRVRRGIYTEWRRTSPYASMMTFDATSREVCTIRRNRSNTPLQALVTLNDPVYIEAAQALARRISNAAKTPEERTRAAWSFVLQREPSPSESQRTLQLLADARTQFAQDPKKATEMATNPIGAAPKDADLTELAAWTAVSNVLLNLDETLMKR